MELWRDFKYIFCTCKSIEEEIEKETEVNIYIN